MLRTWLKVAGLACTGQRAVLSQKAGCIMMENDAYGQTVKGMNCQQAAGLEDLCNEAPCPAYCLD